LFVLWTVRAEFLYVISHIIDQETIRGLEVCRAPGKCNTTNRVLKHLPKLAINFLTKTFNAALRRQYLPAAGKYDHVIFVRSQGRISGCLCPVVPLASCRENILFSSILSEISGGGLLLGEQFGFPYGGSLTLHVAPLVGKFNRKFNEKRLTGTVFLDACD